MSSSSTADRKWQQPSIFAPTQSSSSSAGGGELIKRFIPTSGDDTAFKTALYNMLLFVLVAVCLTGLLAVYHLMFMFLKPMLWAVLVGSVLFPVKRKITAILKDWLNGLQDSSTPLVLGVCLLPWKWLNFVSEKIWALMMSKTGFAIFLTFCLLKVITYERMFPYILGIIGRIYEIMDAIIGIFMNKWVLPAILLYSAAYLAWVYVQPVADNDSEDKDSRKKFVRVLSVPIWCYILALVSTYFGPFRVVVFVVSSAVIGLISAGLISGDAEEEIDGRPGEHFYISCLSVKSGHS